MRLIIKSAIFAAKKHKTSEREKNGIGPTWVPWIKHNFGYIRPTLPFPHISLSIASRILFSHNNFCNFVTSACYQHTINILSAWKRINIHILFYSILFFPYQAWNGRRCKHRVSKKKALNSLLIILFLWRESFPSLGDSSYCRQCFSPCKHSKKFP